MNLPKVIPNYINFVLRIQLVATNLLNFKLVTWVLCLWQLHTDAVFKCSKAVSSENIIKNLEFMERIILCQLWENFEIIKENDLRKVH